MQSLRGSTSSSGPRSRARSALTRCRTAGFLWACRADLLDTTPGFNQATAEVTAAETGGSMTRFATAKHLASWAGACPGHHESAGRTKNTKARSGNPCPKGTLGLAAFGTARAKETPTSPPATALVPGDTDAAWADSLPVPRPGS
ncbi:transposase [Streptomyces sp. 21So2-11]|uniref:transposase n=1 Tax=Streptomyces sp. 21So2-11 TaxID=3144408 RepID=UPI00321A363B